MVGVIVLLAGSQTVAAREACLPGYIQYGNQPKWLYVYLGPCRALELGPWYAVPRPMTDVEQGEHERNRRVLADSLWRGGFHQAAPRA